MFGAIEMAGPFLLLGHAEQTLPSGITGLLVATVPLFGAVIALLRGDRSVLSPLRLASGSSLGFGGVAIDRRRSRPASAAAARSVAIGEVLLVALLYAIAPFIIARKLRDVPSLGSMTLSLIAVGLFYLPIALLTQHQVPTLPQHRRAPGTRGAVHRASLSSASSRSSARSAPCGRRCSPTSTRSSRSVSGDPDPRRADHAEPPRRSADRADRMLAGRDGRTAPPAADRLPAEIVR